MIFFPPLKSIRFSKKVDFYCIILLYQIIKPTQWNCTGSFCAVLPPGLVVCHTKQTHLSVCDNNDSPDEKTEWRRRRGDNYIAAKLWVSAHTYTCAHTTNKVILVVMTTLYCSQPAFDINKKIIFLLVVHDSNSPQRSNFKLEDLFNLSCPSSFFFYHSPAVCVSLVVSAVHLQNLSLSLCSYPIKHISKLNILLLEVFIKLRG